MDHRVYHVVGAELRQLSRDVNTLLVTVAFPFLLFPGALWAYSQLRSVVEGWEQELVPVVEVVGEPRRALPDGLDAGAADAAVARVAWSEDSVTVEFERGNALSELAKSRLVAAFDEPWPVEVHDVAPREEALVLVVSRVVPLVLVVLGVFASMYPAVEAVVADRERGTRETSFVTAAPRWVFLAGKLVAVATIALLSVLACTASAVVTLGHAASLLGVHLSVPPARLAAVLPMAGLTSLYGAAVSFLAASPTRNFKQAQNFASVAMTSVVLLAVLGALPRAELAGVLGWVPVANAVLVMRAWLLGEAPWAWTVVAVAQLGVLTVLAVVAGTRFSGVEASR